MNLKYAFLILLATMALRLNGQPQSKIVVPNQFHGYVLGTPLCEFSMKVPKDSKTNSLILLSSITTKNMLAYTLKNQLTEGGDKIDIELFFYDDSLAVIRVAYLDPQAKKELVEAIKIKFGNDARLDDNLYNDPLSGSSRIIENLYWEKSPCCVLNLTSTDIIGLIYLTFAEKDVQVKMKNLELLNNQKRIN